MILIIYVIVAQEIFSRVETSIKKLGTVMGESHIDFRTQCVIMTQTT